MGSLRRICAVRPERVIASLGGKGRVGSAGNCDLKDGHG